MEDLKSHVEQAKKNSSCRQCGLKGHWAGDEQCPAPKKGHSGKKDHGKGKSVSSSHRGAAGNLALFDDLSASPSSGTSLQAVCVPELSGQSQGISVPEPLGHGFVPVPGRLGMRQLLL